MNERAVLILLREWHRQLQDELTQAIDSLPDPEPIRERRWRVPALFHGIIRPPAEDDPPDQWEWVKIKRTPPHLQGLEQAIERIGAQIDDLG